MAINQWKELFNLNSTKMNIRFSWHHFLTAAPRHASHLSTCPFYNYPHYFTICACPSLASATTTLLVSRAKVVSAQGIPVTQGFVGCTVKYSLFATSQPNLIDDFIGGKND